MPRSLDRFHSAFSGPEKLHSSCARLVWLVRSPHFCLHNSRLGIRIPKVSYFTLLCISLIIIVFQGTYTRASAPPEARRMDIFDHGYAPKIILYVFFGILDSMWQTTAYWLMGSMCNDPANWLTLLVSVRLLFRVPLFIHPTKISADKSLQSAGAAGVWRADGVHLP